MVSAKVGHRRCQLVKRKYLPAWDTYIKDLLACIKVEKKLNTHVYRPTTGCVVPRLCVTGHAYLPLEVRKATISLQTTCLRRKMGQGEYSGLLGKPTMTFC